MELLIDYLTFSVRNVPLGRLLRIFGIAEVEYTEANSRMIGYRHGLYSKGIQVFYGGEQGICISLSGTGCRRLESLHPNLNWSKYIGLIYRHYPRCHISRLDIACDERDGILKYNRLAKHSLERYYVSRFHRPLVSGGREEAVIWGSPTSMIRIRIYNKALERNVDGHWMRCELQLRDDAATSFCREWFSGSDLGTTFSGIVINEVRYTKQKNTGINTNRLETAAYWRKFLNGAERLKMAYPKGLVYNMERLEDYVFGQAGKSLAVWLEANGGDVDLMQQRIALQRFRFTLEDRVKIEMLVGGSNENNENHVRNDDRFAAVLDGQIG